MLKVKELNMENYRERPTCDMCGMLIFSKISLIKGRSVNCRFCMKCTHELIDKLAKGVRLIK